MDSSLSLSLLVSAVHLGSVSSLQIRCSFHPCQTVLIVGEVIELSLFCESCRNGLFRGLNGLLTSEHLVNVSGVMR